MLDRNKIYTFRNDKICRVTGKKMYFHEDAKKNPNICEADLIQIMHRTAVVTALIFTLAAPCHAVKVLESIGAINEI